MTRIDTLILADPAEDTPQGRELSLLADLAMFYERDIFPSERPSKIGWSLRLNPVRWFFSGKHK